jgi:hypothetical protein
MASVTAESVGFAVPEHVDRVRVGEPGQRQQLHFVRILVFYDPLIISEAVIRRDPREYLKHVMTATNMSCLTPEGALSGECDFLSANMYARSLFGEDALANLSIERTEAGTVTGHVRIRSKTQGIALSLGDKITMGMCVILSICCLTSDLLVSLQLKKKTNPLRCESLGII